ncbi:Glutamyl-tRNA reductase 1, chloroplastic [Hordeum vulgare]|nr:Glutamyl-tRNA reductase 1, chloroplastic [Hordeum vulgare]
MPTSPTEIASSTRCNVLEYLQIYTPQPKKIAEEKWRPPGDDMVKINLDGSHVPGESHAGWGVVARTLEGNIICARAGRQENVNDAFAAKVLAMSHAVTLAADTGIINVEFETDSQLLLEALDMNKVDSWAYAAIIEDTKYQLKMWFSRHVITVCRRFRNVVAHELASVGRLLDPNHYVQWKSDVPTRVAECALGDMPTHC